MEELIEKYIESIIDSDDFKRLKELKEIIDIKYQGLILEFKTKESIYNDIKKYKIENKKAQINFMNAKSNLYQQEEVKEYFILSKKIEDKINKDIDKIKKALEV